MRRGTMTQVTVRIPMPLRAFTGGAAEVVGSGATVREVLVALGQEHSGLLPRILTPEGQIRSFVNLYLGEDNVRVLQGLDTSVPGGVVLSIIPAVAGGTGATASSRWEVSAGGRTPSNVKRLLPPRQSRGASLGS